MKTILENMKILSERAAALQEVNDKYAEAEKEVFNRAELFLNPRFTVTSVSTHENSTESMVYIEYYDFRGEDEELYLPLSVFIETDTREKADKYWQEKHKEEKSLEDAKEAEKELRRIEEFLKRKPNLYDQVREIVARVGKNENT